MTTEVLEQPRTEAKQGAKVTLPLASLQAALAKISPAIPGASCTIPVLGNVRIENTPDGTTFTASDLDLSIRATLPRQQEASEPFLLAAHRLTGYVKLLEGDSVSIAPAKAWATLLCGRSRTKLPLDKIANYPLTKFGIDVDSLTLSQGVALRMLHHTIFAISAEESRYVLNGSLVEVKDGCLRMVATDGHRMAIYTARVGAVPDSSMVLPSPLLKAMAKAIEDDDAKVVRIADVDPSICIEIAGDMPLSMTCRKIAGQFPNYQAVVPVDSAVRVTVNATEMLMSLGRCVAMSDKQTCCVKMTIAAESIGLKAVDATAGETEESVAASGVGDEFKSFVVGFNGQYLIDVFKRLKGDVTLSFAKADGQNPMKLSTEPADGERFDYVVMPMRV